MACLRVLLDEDIEADLKNAFPKKVQVYTVTELGLSGKSDRYVVEEAVQRKCLIVTANYDFVPEYEHHHWREGKDGRYFYGLIFLKPPKTVSRVQQIREAVKVVNPMYDDVIAVSGNGAITRKRLDGPINSA